MDLGPFPRGINNRARNHSVPAGSLRNAINADIDAEGNARRRKGMTKVVSGLTCRDAFGCPSGQFYVDGTTLKQFTGSAASDIYAGPTGSSGAFCWQDGVVYFSDGVVNFRIVNGSAVDWGITTPAAPQLALTSGALGAGTYTAAIAWVDADGRQSALSAIRSITLTDSQGLIIQGLPGTPATMITAPSYLRLFLSAPNGEVLYRLTDLAVGSISPYTISVTGLDRGFEAVWQPLGVPPAGRLIRFYNGRCYIADDSGLIWYSQPLSYHLFNLASDYLFFPEAVTVMEPTDTGIFVATDKQHYFLFGAGPEDDGFQLVDRLDYGAPFNNGQHPNFAGGGDVTWQSHRGQIVASGDGSLRNVVEDNAAVDNGSAAATLIREDDGERQFIASIDTAQPSTLAVSNWITAEVIRRS